MGVLEMKIKGEWKDEGDGIITCNGVQIASVLPKNRDCNAYLIVAAPDMYEALKHASRALHNLHVQNGFLTQQQCLLDKEIDTAIGKADGCNV
jgi:hypothetical protein